jgi:hypothetical protein
MPQEADTEGRAQYSQLSQDDEFETTAEQPQHDSGVIGPLPASCMSKFCALLKKDAIFVYCGGYTRELQQLVAEQMCGNLCVHSLLDFMALTR